MGLLYLKRMTFYKVRNFPFYVMEYIEGLGLLEFIQRRDKMDSCANASIVNKLEDLHRNNWVFGDLKPENLIVTTSRIKYDVLMLGVRQCRAVD